MYCEAVDNLYVKANGEVPCACSPGEHEPLFRLTAGGRRKLHVIKHILNGAEIRRIRREIHRGRLPFDYCSGCGLFRENREYGEGDGYESRRGYLKKLYCLQLEASYLCNVDCPYCVPMDMRKKLKKPPYHMSLSLVRRVVSDINESNVPVLHCALSGRGEPLMNPALPSIVREVKDRLGCTVSVHTNGNFRFDPRLVEAGVSTFSVAVDGTTQASYAKYRRRGELKKALRFMEEALRCRERTKGGLNVIWQYILFNWNTKPLHLERLFRRASDLGVDVLLLTETDTPGGELFAKDPGTRKQILKNLGELSSRHPDLHLQMMLSRTVYRDRPPVDLEMRLRRGGKNASRRRPMLEGRMKNLRLEKLSVRAEIHGVEKTGRREHLYHAGRKTLRPRQEYVDGIRMDRAALPEGCDRIRVKLFEGKSGKPFLERDVPL